MNKTLQEQYNLIKEGKGNKQQFFKSARHIFPDLVTPVNTFEDTVHILKNRGVISEGIGGLVTKGKTPDWHSIFKENMNSIDYGSWKKGLIDIIKKDANLDDNEIAVDEEEIKRYYKEGKSPSEVYNNVWLKDAGNFRNISFESLNKKDEDDEKYKEMIKRHEEEQDAKHTLPNIGNLREAKEAKAIEKEPTKDVVDMETKGYDYKDKKNYDNVFGQEFLQGFYTEMSDSKNEGKTVEELRAIVAKNLAKDINHYAKEGQFGLKGVGYETEAPGLGTPKEAKGKHKSSGYGDLKEGKDISIKGKIVKNAKQNGDKSYTVTYEDDTTSNVAVSNDAWDDLNDRYGDLKKSLKESILRSQIHILIKEILKEKKTSINENEGMMINGKSVDIGSIEIEGIDTRDYPDFSDAYAVYAEFEDGTPLTDSELDELNDNYGDVIHELIFDNQLYLDENKKK
jgi:hypothetical protein